MRNTTPTHGTFTSGQFLLEKGHPMEHSTQLREGEQLAFANTSLHRKKNGQLSYNPPYSRREMATRADGLIPKPRLKATE